MDVAALKSSLEANPNDPRPLNQALKLIFDDPGAEGSLDAFDEILEFLFAGGDEIGGLLRTLDTRLRALKGGTDEECLILAQVATRYWQDASTPDRAEPFFRKLRDKTGYAETAREFYTELYLGRSNWRRVEELVFQAAGITPEDESAPEVWQDLATLARDRGEATREAQYLDKIAKAGRADESVVDRLLELNRENGRWHVVASLLAQRIEKTDDLERLRGLFRELVSVYTDEMGVEAKALSVYTDWRKRDPESPEVARALLELLAKLGRWPNYAKLLREIADAATEPEEQGSLLRELAETYIERLRNIPEAIRAYEAARDLAPEDPDLTSRLKALYRERRDFESYIPLVHEELAGIDDEGLRREGMVELAELAQREVRKPDLVIPLWEAVLAEDPEHGAAQDALADLYERTHAFDRLLGLLEARADTETDPAEQARILERIAGTAHTRLKDEKRAAEAWERLLEVAPEHPRAFAEVRKFHSEARDWSRLEALFRGHDRVDDLARLLESQTRKASGDGDRAELLEVLVRLYSDDLNDVGRALRPMEQLHELRPEDPSVLERMADLARRAEDTRRLYQALESLAPLIEGSGARKAVYLELADLSEHKLLKPSEAFSHAVDAYKEDPTDRELIARLTDLARRADAADRLLDVLDEAFPAVASEPETALPIALEIARVAAEDDRDLERSVRFYGEVLGRDPEHPEALEALLADGRRRGDLEAQSIYLGRLAKVVDADRRVDLLAEAADLQLATGDPEGAEQTLGEAIGCAPERPDLRERLERLFVQQDRHEEAAGVVSALLEFLGSTLHAAARADAHARLGLLRLMAGGDLSDAVPDLLAALSEVPDHDEATESLVDHLARLQDRDDVLAALERSLRLQGRHADLADVIEVQARRSTGADLRDRLGELVEIYRGPLGDAHGLFRTLGRLYREDPSVEALREDLEQAAEAGGLWFHLGALYRTLAGDVSTELRRSLLLRVAEVESEHLDDPDASAEALEAVAAEHPEDREILSRLVDIYRLRERHLDQAQAMRRLVAATPDAHALDTRLDLVRLLRDALDRPEEALEVLQETRGIWSASIEVLGEMRALLERLDRVEEAEEVLRDLASRSSDPQECARHLLDAGRLSLERLDRPGEALGRAAEVFDEIPNHPEAIRLARDIFESCEAQRAMAAALLAPALRASGAAGELVPVLEALEAEAASAETRSGLHLELSDLYRGPLDDPELSTLHLHAASEQVPGRADLRARLEEIARSAGTLREHVDFLESLASSEDVAAEIQVELSHEAARILQHDLDDPRGAMERHARVVRDLDPECRESLDLLLDHHAASGDHEAFLEWIEHALDVRPDAEERRALYLRAVDSGRATEEGRRALAFLERAEEELPQDLELRKIHVETARATGEPALLAEALQGLLRTTSDAAERAEARLERARILAELEGREEDALLDLALHLEEHPDDRAAVALVAELHERTGAYEDQVRDLERLRELSAEDEGEAQAELALRIARIYGAALEQPEDAVLWYAEVLDGDPTHPDAMADLEDLLARDLAASEAFDLLDSAYESGDRVEDRVRIRERRADQMAMPEARSTLLGEAADLAERELADPGRALRNLMEVLATDPARAGLLERCEGLARRAEALGVLAERLAAVAEAVGAPELQARLYRRRAELLIDAGGEEEGAVEAFRQALAVHPEDEEAQERLDAIYTERGRHGELAELLEHRALHGSDGDARRGFQLRRADLLSGPLDRAAEAGELLLDMVGGGDPPDPEVMERLRALFEAGVSGDDIFPAIERVYQAAGNAHGLAGLLETRAVQLGAGGVEVDGDQRDGDRVAILRRLGELLRSDLGEHERAAKAFAEAWRADPGDPSLHEALRETCAGAGLQGIYADTLVEVAGRCHDETARADLLLESAGLRRTSLEQPEEAERIYREVLDFAPDCLDAWASLDAVLDETSRPSDLHDVLLHKADLEDGAARVSTLHRLADLQSGVLEALDPARETLLRLLDLNSADLDAHMKLELVLQAAGDQAALAAAYRAHADVVADGATRAELMQEAGKIYHEIGDAEEAAAVWEEALAAAPSRLDLIRPLAGLARTQERWERLVELLRQELRALGDAREEGEEPGDEDVEHEVAVHRELAELLADRLDDAYAALGEMRSAVDLAPGEADLWRRLRSLSRDEAQADLEVRAIEALLGLEETGEEERTDLLRALAVLRTEVIPDAERAAEAWADYLGRRPEDRAAQEAYLELLESAGKHRALADHLGVVAAEARSGFEEEERGELRLRQAEVLMDRVGMPEEAAGILEALTAARPESEPAWTLLERIYRGAESPEKLAQLLVRRVDHVADLADKVGMLREVATIYAQQLDAHDNALYALLAALEHDPEDGSLLQAALVEARAAGDFEDLLAMGSSTLGALEPEVQEERLRTLAGIASEEAGSHTRAIDLLEGGLERLGDRGGLLEPLCDLLQKEGRNEDLVGALERLAGAQEDPFLKVPVMRRRARILEETLQDYPHAVEAYEAIVSLEPGDADALGALERIYGAQDAPADLVRTCERLIDAQPARQGELLRRIGQLYLERLDEPQKASEAFEQAVALDPTDRVSFELLEAAYGTMEDWQGLADVYDRWSLAEQEPSGRADICRKLAILREEVQEDLEGAVDAFLQALLAHPEHEDALAGLERLYRKTARPEELLYLYKDLVGRTSDVTRRVALLRRAAQLAVDDLGDREGAERLLQELLRVSPDDSAALGDWLELMEELNEPHQTETFLKVHLHAVRAPAVLRRTAVALASVLHRSLGDTTGALAIVESSIEADDDDPAVLDLRADLYQALERLEDLGEVLERRLARANAGPDRAGVLARLGALSEARGEIPEAMSRYERALEEQPNHGTAMRCLALLFLQQDTPVEAEPLLTLLVEELERNRAPAAERAEIYRHLGDTARRLLDQEGAVAHFSRALELDPDNLGARLTLGRVAHEAGDSDTARRHLEAALERPDCLDLDDVKHAHQVLGEICLKSGETEAAREHLLEVIALDPANDRVIDEMVDLSIRYGDFEGALDDLRALAGLRESPLEKYEILLRMAEIARDRIGDPAQAEGLLSEAIQVHSHGRAARIELLKIYRSEQRFADAVRILESLADMESDTQRKVQYLRSAAKLARELQDQARAIELLNRALDLDPTRLDAFILIDEIVTESRDWEAQERNYRRMLERIRGREGMAEVELKLYSGLGEIYRSRLKNMDYAVDAFELAHKLQPDHVPTLEILADLYTHVEKPERAVDVQRELCRLKPGDAGVLRELFDLAVGAGDTEAARVAGQVLVLLRKADDRVSAYNQERVRPLMIQVRRSLDLAAWQSLIIPGGTSAVVGEIFAILYRTLASSLEARDLKALGLKKRDEIDATGKEIIASVLRRASALLGLGQVKVFRSGRNFGITVEPTIPACIVVGSDMLSGKTEAELAYLVAKHLTLLLPMHALAALYGPARLDALALAAEVYARPSTPIPAGLESVKDAAEAIAQSIAPPDADRLRRLIPELEDRRSSGVIARYLDDVEVASTRAGLLACDNLGVATQVIQTGVGTVLGNLPAGEQIRQLVRWMLSDSYRECRKALDVADL